MNDDGDIDYSKYTLLELEEAFAGINKRKYPKNFANLRTAYALLSSTLPPVAQTAAVDEIKEPWQPKYDEHGRYIPNLIPSGERNSQIIFSLLLLAYGGYGVWVNDLYIPGKHSRGIHLQDVPAWLMYGAMVCACLVMISVVVDHYDQRNNERHYRSFANVGKIIGWGLFGISLFMAMD